MNPVAGFETRDLRQYKTALEASFEKHPFSRSKDNTMDFTKSKDFLSKVNFLF